MIGKGTCDKEFFWNPSNYECECDKSCDAGEYLDYANCKCRKILINKLVKKCSENIDEKKLRLNELISVSSNDYKYVYRSCEHNSRTIYIVFLVMFFIISMSIRSIFICFYWYLTRVILVLSVLILALYRNLWNEIPLNAIPLNI